MSKRFKQVNVQHFATLVQEIDISKYTQKEYVEIVEELYMGIFRHNTNGDFVVAYTSVGADNSSSGIVAQIHNAAGTSQIDPAGYLFRYLTPA